MLSVDSWRIKRHRMTNAVHSVLILGGMSLLAWVLASWFFGVMAAYALAGVVIVSLLITPRLAPDILIRAYQAQYLSPAQAPGLYRLIQALSERAELTNTPKVYIAPSNVLNAFAIGGSDDAAIVVSQGLLRSLSQRELAGVLAHEIAHIRNGDVRVMMIADSISRLVFLLTHIGQFLLLINLPLIWLGAMSVDWAIILILLLYPILLSLLQLGLSRTREYLADATAAQLTGDPAGLASALRAIEERQGSWMERIFAPGRGESQPSLFRTHPPTEKRIQRLLDLMQQGPKEGLVFTNTEVYPQDLLRGRANRPKRYWHGYWY
ncbi:zinc metalloprotease HtpX [Hahella aquimaris]|uniref:zinc metalloprotease HtpX n=1 Tax=Hahella sp. HNIBRBA332 TaxID=3015983 RepID=UPI00273B8D96|nr:zinc metalloprotease HtpX [Hahella sp. HNIBRBA332]WLQ14350.1 zinc metalloprotease HtpX [Hahella sp. HNIBRBA332]